MNWLKNYWYVAGFANELAENPWVTRRFLNVPVIMMQTSDGKLAAFEDLCPHRLVPLSTGKRVGDEVQCGYHGMKFSITGQCTEVPGQPKPPAAARARTFPLAAKHGLLWIWMGNPELASPDLITDLHWNDDPLWGASRGYTHIDGDFRLAVDNLNDLGHESWVHTRTIGNAEEESVASFPVKVTSPAEGLLHVMREMPNIVAPPFFAMVLNHQGRINRWQNAVTQAPCMCLTDFGVYPVGTPPEKAYRSHVLHILTPETENTTHYFWSTTRNYRIHDEALTESIRQAIAATFAEDVAMINIQQKQLEIHGNDIPRVASRLDEAPIRMRRILKALCDKEAADPNYVFRPNVLIEDTLPDMDMAKNPAASLEGQTA